jgi:WD40 repeat protein
LAIVGGEGIDFFESPFWQWSRAIAVDTEVTNLVFSPDGTWLIGSFANQDIKFWHISDGVSEYTGTRHEAKISSIGISSDGAFLASLDVSGNLFIWDINRKAVLKEINNSDRIVTAVWSPVVSSLLVLGTKSGQIVSQRYPDDKSLPPQYINNPGFPIAGFAFSLDGSTLASFSEVGPIKLWKVADGSPMQTVNCPSGRMSDLVFSRDGSLLIASTSSVLSLIDLFDIQNGKFLQTLKKENGKISNLFLFPDGMLLGYITNDSNLHIWSIE